MPTGFIIRPVEEKDRNDLADLLRQNYLGSNDVPTDAFEVQLIADRVEEQIRTSLDPCSPNQLFLAVCEDQPVALAYVVADEKRGGLLVDDLFTKKEFEKQGLASALLDACENHGRSRGEQDLHLSVVASASPLVDYYSRRSWLKQMFSDADREPTDIDPANQAVATHLMKKMPAHNPGQ